MRIAVAQMLSGTDPADQPGADLGCTRRAAEQGARLVVFPEAAMCRLGVPLGPVAEPIDGRWADGVRGRGGQRVTVFAGMFTPAPDGRFSTPCWPPAPAWRPATTRFTCTTRSA